MWSEVFFFSFFHTSIKANMNWSPDQSANWTPFRIPAQEFQSIFQARFRPSARAKIRQSSIWYTGSAGHRVEDQASDVPSIIFFITISCKILVKICFNLFLSYYNKNIIFECPKSIRNNEKIIIMLGTSDTCPGVPANQRIFCRLTDFKTLRPTQSPTCRPTRSWKPEVSWRLTRS